MTKQTAMGELARRIALSVGAGIAIAAWMMVAADAAGPFDGGWNVVITCSRTPDGALGYELRFPAVIRDGMLSGQFHSATTGAAVTLMGQIRPTGEARLTADGQTGAVEYTVGRVQPGTPYHYTADARFGPTSGSGARNELRPCTLNFTKT